MFSVGKKSTVSKYFTSDREFNSLYPEQIRLLAGRHWTPLNVARKAASFLGIENGSRILDIGSGVGKFCLSAAYFYPRSHFYGVEQRPDLLQYAETAKKGLGLENVSFISGNFTQLDLRNFDHLYFYNAFYENLGDAEKIDEGVEFSEDLYHHYHRHLHRQLTQMPAGTRLATFYSTEAEIPDNYYVVGAEMDNLLKFWIKV